VHISTRQVLRYFHYTHLPEGKAQETSRLFYNLAVNLANNLPEDPETTIALRKLLESKDAAVRSVMEVETF
jgi:hypothetical protein